MSVRVPVCVIKYFCIPIGTLLCMVLNDYRVLADIFTLKAHSADIAQEWMDQIAAAQVSSVCYNAKATPITN